MSVFFNNNFGLKNNIENRTSDSKPVVSGKIANLPEYISALKEGSVFKGEILDVRNNAVKILLSSNDILNARTDGSVQMNIGDILNFRVENNTGMSMLVKAVSVGNTNGGINMLMSALQSADVPVNERNISLVKELVDNGQPIDKNTIKTLVSNLNSYSELDIDTAVNMFKHDIPITKDNVTQFNNYIEQNNKLMDSYSSMPNDIVDTLNEYVQNNPEADITKLANDILRVLTGKENADISTIVSNGDYANIEPDAAMTQNTPVMTQSDSAMTDSGIANSENKLSNVNVINDEYITKSETVIVNENTVNTSNTNGTGVDENISEFIAEDGKVLLKGEDSLNLNKTPINLLNEQINTEQFKEALAKVVKKSLFIDKEIFTRPEEEIKAELEKYYKDVESKVDKLLNVLENSNMDKSALHSNISNVKGNLNFMNDMYNMALYMQFPVKFQESDAHGELYVLNRNRNKNKDDDTLTAFLHLDMENLGVTDVNIKLEGDKLSTKFSLEDVVSQDIVEEHLHELKDRLDEKGYTTTLLVEELGKNQEDKQAPFEQVLALEEPKNFIKRYTFDVRA